MKILLSILATLVWAAPAFALDVCTQPLQTVAINIASATTTQIVGGTSIGGNKRRIVVCGYDFTSAGTSPTYQFEEGTGSACGTGTTALSGVYAPTSGIKTSYGGAGATIMATDSGNELCIVSGGTPSLQGVLNYVVMP